MRSIGRSKEICLAGFTGLYLVASAGLVFGQAGGGGAGAGAGSSSSAPGSMPAPNRGVGPSTPEQTQGVAPPTTSGQSRPSCGSGATAGGASADGSAAATRPSTNAPGTPNTTNDRSGTTQVPNTGGVGC